jgi:hypothetical protein
LFFPDDVSITIISDLLSPYPKPSTYLTRPCFQVSRSVVVSENNSGFFSHHSNPTGLVWSSIDWKMGIILSIQKVRSCFGSNSYDQLHFPVKSVKVN